MKPLPSLPEAGTLPRSPFTCLPWHLLLGGAASSSPAAKLPFLQERQALHGKTTCTGISCLESLVDTKLKQLLKTSQFFVR